MYFIGTGPPRVDELGYEPEGVDYHDGLLRVEVRSPGVCSPEVIVYQYRRHD